MKINQWKTAFSPQHNRAQKAARKLLLWFIFLYHLIISLILFLIVFYFLSIFTCLFWINLEHFWRKLKSKSFRIKSLFSEACKVSRFPVLIFSIKISLVKSREDHLASFRTLSAMDSRVIFSLPNWDFETKGLQSQLHLHMKWNENFT